MLAGAHQHGMEGSSKLGGMPNVTIVHEYGGAVRIHGQFQFGSVRAGTQWAKRGDSCPFASRVNGSDRPDLLPFPGWRGAIAQGGSEAA